jgi:hypothetical protein
MSLNRYTMRGFTMFKHLPEPKPKMRKGMWLMSMAISNRFMLRRNHKYFNVLTDNIYPIMRKGAFNE